MHTIKSLNNLRSTLNMASRAIDCYLLACAGESMDDARLAKLHRKVHAKRNGMSISDMATACHHIFQVANNDRYILDMTEQGLIASSEVSAFNVALNKCKDAADAFMNTRKSLKAV